MLLTRVAFGHDEHATLAALRPITVAISVGVYSAAGIPVLRDASITTAFDVPAARHALLATLMVHAPFLTPERLTTVTHALPRNTFAAVSGSTSGLLAQHRGDPR
jgi:hypothetical protein